MYKNLTPDFTPAPALRGLAGLSCVLAVFLIFGATQAQTLRARVFAFEYSATVRDVPTSARQVDLWLPLPHNDPYQKITGLTVDAPYPYTIQSAQYGNRMLHLIVSEPKRSAFTVTVRFNAVRYEHLNAALLDGDGTVAAKKEEAADPDMARWLQPDRLVPLDDKIRTWAREVVTQAGAKTDLEKARAIYNHIVATVKYDKSGQGWGRGDIYYACDARRGNCTDFHAIFIGYCRALGIPARFSIGFPLPRERGEGQISGYHCWAECYVKGIGWIPVDASEAAKDPARREYFFGAHDENRIEFTRGRDLTLAPKQAAEPINYFIYPYAEVDGRAHAAVDKTFRYQDLNGRQSQREPDESPVRQGAADSNELSDEVASLRRRVADLEAQNREMLELLRAMNAKLEAAVTQPQVTQVAVRMTTATARESSEPVPPAPVAAPSTPAPQAAAPELVKWNEVVAGSSRFRLYGFLRLDLMYDSQRPAGNPQSPFFIASPDAAGNRRGAENFSMTPRLTRLGLDYTGPRIAALGDAKLTGKFEIDFNAGGTESRPLFRERFAWLRLSWERFAVEAGQDRDLVSPLLPTPNQTGDMNYVGNTGDRRPMVRAEWNQKTSLGQWSLAGAAGLTGAIDAQDFDNNGYRDGEESGRPNLQSRIGYSRSLWVKDQAVNIGFSGYYAWTQTTRAFAGRTGFRSQLLAVDYTVPLAGKVLLRGEGWWGRNLNDVRGGIAQGINPNTGREIRARGGWAELNFRISKYWMLLPGFIEDDPVDADLPNGGRTRNRSAYFGQRITPSGNFLIGVDYYRWRTDYKGSRTGIDNRMNIFFQYSF